MSDFFFQIKIHCVSSFSLLWFFKDVTRTLRVWEKKVLLHNAVPDTQDLHFTVFFPT